MLEKYQDKEILIICPNEIKMNYLEENKTLLNIKYMTKEEFFNNYFFSITNESRIYLMKKYNLKLDVVNLYLNNLKVIELTKEYKNDKLNFLKNLKKELLENNLLKVNNYFKDYIKTKKIIVNGYNELDMYEEDIFKTLNADIILKERKNSLSIVYAFNTLEKEISFICLKIIDLINSGVDINKISLVNISSEDKYLFKKLFKYYNIPINIDTSSSIYSTSVVRKYLETKQVDLEDTNNINITSKLVNVLNNLISIKDDSNEYQEILINELRNTKLKQEKYTNAVNIKDLYNSTFKSDEYIFVASFNQDVLPKIKKDEDYISDKEKSEVRLYTSSFINKRRKQLTISILSSINNLIISYHSNSTFTEYYPSSLINELNLTIKKEDITDYSKSNFYNKLKLGKMLDNYYMYNEKNTSMLQLYTHYKISYNTYDNSFKGIDHTQYINSLKNELILSYTSINTYYECGFKYYVNNVLKLNPFEETFASFIGNLFHYILQIRKREDFDLEKSFNKYLEKRELTIKEKVLLIRLKKELLETIDLLKKQDLLTGYNDELYETKIEVDLEKEEIDTYLKGFIDKIMIYKKVEDTYFSIVDYKTGYIDTSMQPLKYGLHMQLPVYLYLIHNYKEIKSPIFTGIYYQNILFDYPTFDKKDIDISKKERIKLQGYSTPKTELLERFDSTYEKSELIKTMEYKEEKGFNRYTKLLSDDLLFDLLEFTKKKINQAADNIIDANFKIEAKIYDKINISCKYCKFKDLCYVKEKDIIYLEKLRNLDFLGGEDNV